MKVRCNVCGNKELVKLPNPETKKEGFTVYCPNCDKLLAEVERAYFGTPFWYVYDSEYDKRYECKPVEIVEY